MGERLLDSGNTFPKVNVMSSEGLAAERSDDPGRRGGNLDQPDDRHATPGERRAVADLSAVKTEKLANDHNQCIISLSEIRGRLFGALISLMRDEEILTMTEQMIETLERDPLLNTPFLRRIRDEGRDEGRVALRQSILDTLMVRFDPPITRYRRIETQLAETADLGQLQKFLLAVLRASDVADFEQALAR